MTYTNKVKEALNKCKTIDEVIEVEEAIKKTSQVNRRTKKGRELTQELLSLCWDKSNELIKQGAEPF